METETRIQEPEKVLNTPKFEETEVAEDSQPETTQDRKPRKPFSWRVLALPLIAAGALAALPLFLVPESGPVAVRDNLDSLAKQQIQAQFNKAQNSGTTFGLAAELNEKTKEKIRETYSAEIAEPLIEDAEKGLSEIVILKIYDNLEEDGDVVTIQNNLLNVSVPITNALSEIPVPVNAANTSVTLFAAKDGGGGVTVGILDKTQSPLPIPPIPEGVSVTLPLIK